MEPYRITYRSVDGAGTKPEPFEELQEAVKEADGSKSEELTDFRLKSDQAVRRVITGTDIPGEAAPHLASSAEIL